MATCGNRIKSAGSAGGAGSTARAGRAKQKRLAAVAAVAAFALAVVGCSGATSSPSANSRAVRLNGGTATVEVIDGTQPSWIWPFMPVAYYNIYNVQDFQWLLYRPLYMFGNNGTSVQVNYSLSPAAAPVYGDSGKTVTINLKGWKWSNGESIDAADVAFWLNMMKAEKANDAEYSPGTLPDNLSSYSVPSPDTIVLHLTQPYASTWFTYNQLAEITPMPMAWDVTKAGAAAGSGGCHISPANCKAVFDFLTAQAKSASGYASSPVWSVVDGPWKLQSFSATGADTFVPNRKYSGSPKPALSELRYLPYTSDTTQYTALKTGSLDVGYIPSADLPQKPAGSALPGTNPLGAGYYLEPFYSFSIYYYVINYKNPTYGPLFRQLYFRQALLYANDQAGISRAVYRGYAYPTTGAVPAQPANPYLPAIQTASNGQGPYPFDIAKATSLLTSHGWKMVGGVMTCETPARCGAGIKAGTQARFTMDYSTGGSAFAEASQVYKSDASKAGIDISLVGQSFNSIIGADNAANPNWTAANFGGNIYNGPGFLPTGEFLFETGAGSNPGSYSDPAMNKLIKQVEVNSSLSLFHTYATFAAEQLPFIWMPNNYLVQAVKTTLHGVTFNPLYTFLPEYWYFTR